MHALSSAAWSRFPGARSMAGARALSVPLLGMALCLPQGLAQAEAPPRVSAGVIGATRRKSPAGVAGSPVWARAADRPG